MINKIYDHEPETWKQLEEMVNGAFHEMGYESYRNHTVETVRGVVELDVFAKNNKTSISTTIICECKYWDRPINKQVIHAFRSVCADIGAHYGFVISKKGFQSGAGNARENTNIDLLDFNQFQEKFFDEWREGVLMEIVRMRDGLLSNMRTSADLLKVFKKYDLFNRVSDYFIMDNEFPIIDVTDPRGDIDSMEKMTIKSHRDFFEIAKETHAKISKT